MNNYDIVKKFQIAGETQSIVPYGEGHINDTYLVTLKDCPTQYILQKLNTKIFTNYKGLMDNIQKVTSVMHDIVRSQGGDVDRECMRLIPTLDNKAYYAVGNDCWRMSLFVKDTVVYQVIDSPSVFEDAGKAFGKFIARLDGFDAGSLCEVIPNFHNTVDRYEKFLRAIEDNKSNRAHLVQNEIKFVKERADKLSLIVDALANGQIPLRVTHNDTKINNVLIDKNTGKAICIIDLDTIMPGSLLYDFGDSIRSGCNTALEDEKNLDIVDFNINLYEAYCKGFLKGIGEKITDKELEMLHIGAIIITLECGIRFLTDYLDGDIYFKTDYDDHNLVRCHTQFKLVEKMERQSDAMLEIAKKCKNNI
ncbi:MAG: aminoglycoside phosphotransferase family protein [Clostridia bacterium]|nr:aminoglycoside phosphotransferase family protein [Clostridia bacterium]